MTIYLQDWQQEDDFDNENLSLPVEQIDELLGMGYHLEDDLLVVEDRTPVRVYVNKEYLSTLTQAQRSRLEAYIVSEIISDTWLCADCVKACEDVTDDVIFSNDKILEILVNSDAWLIKNGLPAFYRKDDVD